MPNQIRESRTSGRFEKPGLKTDTFWNYGIGLAFNAKISLVVVLFGVILNVAARIGFAVCCTIDKERLNRDSVVVERIMCLVLYLGSDKLRDLVAWDEKAPGIHVTDDDDDAKKVSTHLRKRLTYYIGSDHGCGCGLRQESDYMIDEGDETVSKADNQKRLHDYVADCLADEETVELYSCWSGDEELPQEHERTIDVAELIEKEFFFAERQRTIVTKLPY